MKENVTRIVCDGLNGHRCGMVISGPADGILINGTISNSSNNAVIHVVIDTKGEELALCWTHFRERCPGAIRDREVVHEVESRTVSAAKNARDLGREATERVEYETRYNYEPGNRATGPLPPPDLPHCVEVARALCTLR